jgi:hypothetical protein
MAHVNLLDLSTYDVTEDRKGHVSIFSNGAARAAGLVAVLLVSALLAGVDSQAASAGQ